MNNNMNNVDSIIEKLNNQNKKSNKSIYILLSIFILILVMVIILSIINKTSNYLLLIILFMLFIIGGILFLIIKKNITNEKVAELLKNKDEINNYCEYLNDGIYITKYRLLVINSGFKRYKEVLFNEIVECKESTIYESVGDSIINIPAITITTKDNQNIKIKSSDKLKTLLNMKNNDNRKGKSINSSIIKDYYVFADYQQGFIDLPLFNKKDCSLWIDSDVSISYAEKVASSIKKLSINNISDAIESTIWYYNDLINNYGYNDNLKDIPLILEKNDVLKYLDLEEIYIHKENDNVICYTIWFKTKMEPEHGLSWGVKDGKVVFVGLGSEWTENDINKEYNYAKGYHKKVLLNNNFEK